MIKQEWIDAAAAKLQPCLGDGSREYAESLYQTYVVDGVCHWEDDPAGAVSEDMSYWDG